MIPYTPIEQNISTVSVGAGEVDKIGMDGVKTDEVEVGGMIFGDSGIDVASESGMDVVSRIGTDDVGKILTDEVDWTGIENVVNSSLLTVNDYC